MAKLANVHFDDALLDAIRDDRLVVFAGAGVSMGPPSNLASFWDLANGIAQGTGFKITPPLDRFLGQLQHRGVAVHERAAELLTPDGSEPNTLHYELLRLFRSPERVRLVTTNFDLHFTTAAERVFGCTPSIYRAPALPLGYSFSGIVHVHGALPDHKEIVLTDSDFGKAYLTEGWARRFLVDLFRHYTVLFVGYSHDDVVMNYLARALPADGIAGRYALTDIDGSWDLLGIKPIKFTKVVGLNPYAELNEGVSKLAERTARGALDWKVRIAEVARRQPPTDDETIEEIEQALREPHTTRFFIRIADHPDWLKWLSDRGHLNDLFQLAPLSPLSLLLGGWVVDTFAIKHSNAVFELIASHSLQLNPTVWSAIGHELGFSKQKVIDIEGLERWTSILLHAAPPNVNREILQHLAERCSDEGHPELAARLFVFMASPKLILKPRASRSDEQKAQGDAPLDAECRPRTKHWSLDRLWAKYLRPQVGSVAHQVLNGCVAHLNSMHENLATWGRASKDWDPVSYSRSAVEPHEQDKHPRATDVLLDATRDSLSWLIANEPDHGEGWVQKLAFAKAPLLRRLAIHSMCEHPKLSAEDLLAWLLSNVDLHDSSVRHEVFRAVAHGYCRSSNAARQLVVDRLKALVMPDVGEWPGELRAARTRFDWFHWLLLSAPGCRIAEPELAAIQLQYADWRPSEHPDLARWSGEAKWVIPQSPWAVDELLSKEPENLVDDLIGFNQTQPGGPDRYGLLNVIQESSKQNTVWALKLLQALAAKQLWTADIWPASLQGMIAANLSKDLWQSLVQISSRPELITAWASAVADLLYGFVRKNTEWDADVLGQAESSAILAWQTLDNQPASDEVHDWGSDAISSPAGILTEFWLGALAVRTLGLEGKGSTLPSSYREWFEMALREDGEKGAYARTILAGQIAYLSHIDLEWTREFLLPLFGAADSSVFAQAWDGFLTSGRVTSDVSAILLPFVIQAIGRLEDDLPGRSNRFVELVTTLAVFELEDPTAEMLPALFRSGTKEDQLGFASHLKYFLRQMDETAKQQVWNSWLERYWRDRLQAVPAALDAEEVALMHDWLVCLGPLFPSAVALATRMPRIQIDRSSLLYELRDSELIVSYPDATAKLLIHFCKCGISYQAADIAHIAGRLVGVESELMRELAEGMAFAGAVA